MAGAEKDKVRAVYDSGDEGVRECAALVRRKKAEPGPCGTVVLCPAIFCRDHWRRLPHYLQEELVQAMISQAPQPERSVKVEVLVAKAVAFLLGAPR